MLDTPILSTLQSALDYASVRQSALSDNIANINTPGYQRKDVSFDSVLQQASSGSSGMPLGLATDAEGQITSASGSGADGSPQITTDGSGAMRLDGNNVDTDVEMGRMAKNEIYYQGLAQITAQQFSDLRTAITDDK